MKKVTLRRVGWLAVALAALGYAVYGPKDTEYACNRAREIVEARATARTMVGPCEGVLQDGDNNYTVTGTLITEGVRSAYSVKLRFLGNGRWITVSVTML